MSPYERMSPHRVRVPAHNCMDKWVGKSVLGFRLPGKDILRNYTNKLMISYPGSFGTSSVPCMVVMGVTLVSIDSISIFVSLIFFNY